MFETITKCAIWLAEQHLKDGRKKVKKAMKKNMTMGETAEVVNQKETKKNEP